jgi:hypothetical protein
MTDVNDLATIQVDARLRQLERALESLQPSLNERLQRLEQLERAARTVAPPSPASRGGFARVGAVLKAAAAWMGAELPKFVTAIVLLGVGWGIKDSVDLSIKQRQLDLSYAKEMQGLLQKMAEKNADRGVLESTAVILASYGAPALPALLSELTRSGLRSDAATMGIRLLALTQPAAVCEVLPGALSNRARQFEWQAQEDVVKILGENGCRKAVPALKAYRDAVAAAEKGDTRALAAVVRMLPASPTEDYPRLLESIRQSLANLGTAS